MKFLMTLYAKRKLANLCVYCGKVPPTITHVYCDDCRLKMKEARRRCTDNKKKNGKCVECGKDRGDNGTKVLCRICADKLISNGIRSEAAYDAAGVCIECGMERLGATRYCEKHWFKLMSRANTGTTLNADMLKQKLVMQKYKCKYTGIIIQPGINASLDHVKPISAHPELKSDIDNLVWCHITVNEMKRNIEVDEFVKLCTLICENTNVNSR